MALRRHDLVIGLRHDSPSIYGRVLSGLGRPGYLIRPFVMIISPGSHTRAFFMVEYRQRQRSMPHAK
jgi:hypothetical protein